MTAPVTTKTVYGDVTLKSGQTLQDTRVEGRVIATGADWVVRNCVVVGAKGNKPTSDTGLIMSTSPTARNGLIEGCLLQPQTPWFSWNGVRGRRFTIRDTMIVDVTDGLSLFGTTAGERLDVLAERVVIDSLAFWTAAHAGVKVHSSDNKTHNDCVHIHGGTHVTLRDSTFRAFISQTAGTTQGVPGQNGLANTGIQFDPTTALGPLSDMVVENCVFDGGWAGQIQVAPNEVQNLGVIRQCRFSDRTNAPHIRLNGAQAVLSGNYLPVPVQVRA